MGGDLMTTNVFTGSTTTPAWYLLTDGTRQLLGSTGQSKGQVSSEADHCLAGAIEAFLLHMHASGRADSSIRCYRSYLERLANLLQVRELACVNNSALNQVLTVMKQRACLSESTLNKIRSVFRTFFEWAVHSNLCICNPAALLTLARAESFPTIPITSEETELLLTTIRQSGKANSKRDELLFATYAFTGIRRAEALRLKIGDFDASVKTLHLRKTKGGMSRIQPVPERLAVMLSRYGSEKNSGRFFFVGDDESSHLSLRQAQNRFDYWRESAGLRQQLTIHSFRAGYAGRLYRASGDIWLVARALGHKSVTTTSGYIKTDATDICKTIEIAFPWNSVSANPAR